MTPPEDGGTPQQRPPMRRLDARSLRGLAHPLRLRIFEELNLDGPATSTVLAERLGESTGTISWHLRHLAEHGFIEEETERGTRRERWWRRADPVNELNIADFRDDTASHGAVSLYLQELLQLYFRRVAAYVSEDWEDRWRTAGLVADWTDLRLTPDQLGELTAELTAVVDRHRSEHGDRPAAGARPVVVQLQAFPREGHGEA